MNTIHIKRLQKDSLIYRKYSISILGILSCGDSVEYPDCSFCPMDNKTNSMNGCIGDCHLNPYTKLCEFKGMISTNFKLKRINRQERYTSKYQLYCFQMIFSKEKRDCAAGRRIYLDTTIRFKLLKQNATKIIIAQEFKKLMEFFSPAEMV